MKATKSKKKVNRFKMYSIVTFCFEVSSSVRIFLPQKWGLVFLLCSRTTTLCIHLFLRYTVFRKTIKHSSHSIQEAEQSSAIQKVFLLLNCFSMAIFNSLLVTFFLQSNWSLSEDKSELEPMSLLKIPRLSLLQTVSINVRTGKLASGERKLIQSNQTCHDTHSRSVVLQLKKNPKLSQ